MKKTKKILALALAGMMAASALAGCSGSGGKEETQATTAPQTQAQETKAPETKKEEESSQAQETTDGGWEYKEATLSLLNAVCGVSEVPVIASGGCGCLEHFAQVFEESRADAALAASLFHYRELTVGEVKDLLARRGIPVRRG